MPSSPDPLDAALAELRSAPLAPPTLRREIWQRIAAAETAEEPLGWPARLAAAFARPSFAIAFIAACMCLGLFLAEWRIAQAESARSRQIAQSYLALIDPLLVSDHTQPGPTATR